MGRTREADSRRTTDRPRAAAAHRLHPDHPRLPRSGTSPLTGVRSAAAAVFGPVERRRRGRRPSRLRVRHQPRRPRRAPGRASPPCEAENDRLRQDNRTSELARNRAGRARRAAAGRRRRPVPRPAGPGHRGRGQPGVLLDRHHRRRHPRRHQPRHDRDQRRRAGRPGRRGRPVDLDRRCSRSTPTSGSGSGWRARWTSASSPARASDPLQLDLLNGQARVAEGDRLVTFGSVNDRPFVPGVPVGEVTSVQATPGLADQDRDGAPVRRLHPARPRRRRRPAAARQPARRGAAARSPTPTPVPDRDGHRDRRRRSGGLTCVRRGRCCRSLLLAHRAAGAGRCSRPGCRCPGATPDVVLLVVVALGLVCGPLHGVRRRVRRRAGPRPRAAGRPRRRPLGPGAVPGRLRRRAVRPRGRPLGARSRSSRWPPPRRRRRCSTPGSGS